MTAETASAPRSFTAHHGLEDLPRALRNGTLAIGNFDGVHLGHQAVLATALRVAGEIGGPVAALTFEPNPRDYFLPDRPLFRLTPAAMKLRVLGALGLSGGIVLEFNAALAGLEATAFVEQVLVRALGVRHVAVGADFHFGRARGGTPEFLRASGQRLGFEVSVVPQLLQGDTPVSSTRVREALGTGDVEGANRLLGYPWTVGSTVRPGDQRGRTLGYPTANLALAPSTGLAHGIYAVMAFAQGAWRPAVASFGRRPTFDNGAPLLETFIFDFSGDLYGQELIVAFAAFLRPEQRFEDADALVRQMDQDSAEARAVLAAFALPDLVRRLGSQTVAPAPAI